MSILGQQILENIAILETGVDPRAGAGVPAPVGSVAYSDSGVSRKVTVSDTGWRLIQDEVQASGVYAALVHTHTLSQITDVTITPANLNALDDGVNTALHFHDTDRVRANHTGTQLAATISDFDTAADARITLQKGAVNGLATLDGSGRLPAAQLSISALEYKGNWNASTNTPTLSDATGQQGDQYRVSVAGTQNLGSGAITYDVGDYAIHNGTTFEKADTTDAVASVNGLTGAVSLTTSNIAEETNLYFTDERAQDAALSALVSVDSSSIDFTYNDAGNTFTAVVLPAGVDKNLLGGSALSIANGGTGQISALLGFNALSPLTTQGDLLTRDATNNVRLPVGLAGFVLVAAGTTPVPTWQYFLSHPRRIHEFTQEWMNGTVAGEFGFSAVTAGAGASVTIPAGSGVLGEVRLATGTTATGRASIVSSTGLDTMRSGDGRMRCSWGINPAQLSTAAQEFTLRFGFGDVSGAGDFVDGAYFEYDRVSSVNWRIATASNSTRTKTNTATAVAVGKVWLTVEINDAGTSVAFFINDVSAGTIATNIPNTTARLFGLIGKMEKTVGTTTTTTDVDTCHFAKYWSTAR